MPETAGSGLWATSFRAADQNAGRSAEFLVSLERIGADLPGLLGDEVSAGDRTAVEVA